MQNMEASQNKSCSVCGKEIVEINGVLVHVGGGSMEQKCNICSWTGGQAGGYEKCPRCGDATSLTNTHKAS